MRISLVGQPYASSPNLHQFLASRCADDRYAELRMATAWAKQSGLSRVEGDFRAFRDRGNKITAVVGISEGGATRQGLHLVHKICDASYVFHETGRTFHPKIYFFTGADDWSVFIGSNNLTAGGVFWNYEAAVEISGSFASPDDVALAGQFTALFDQLLEDSDVCKPLDDALIKLLIESPVFRIGDEIRMAGRQRSGATRTEGVSRSSAGPGTPRRPIRESPQRPERSERRDR